MDRFWPRYIQTTQELYASRTVRFREDSADIAPEIAQEMIAARRIGAMEQLAKAFSQRLDNLNAEEKQRLTDMIERRY